MFEDGASAEDDPSVAKKKCISFTHFTQVSCSRLNAIIYTQRRK